MSRGFKIARVFACAALFVSILAAANLAAQESATQSLNAADQKLAQVRELLIRAEEHAQLTSWDRAIECYDEVLKLFPGYQRAHILKGLCYEGKGDTKKAIEEYRVVANSMGVANDLLEEAVLRAERLMFPDPSEADQEAYEIGTALLQRAAALKKEYPEQSKATLNDAIDKFEEQRKATPDSLNLYFELGLALELAGRNGEAIRAFGDYLDRYAKLQLPLTQRQRDIRTRIAILRSSDAEADAITTAISALTESHNNKMPNANIPIGLILGPHLTSEHIEEMKRIGVALNLNLFSIQSLAVESEKIRGVLIEQLQQKASQRTREHIAAILKHALQEVEEDALNQVREVVANKDYRQMLMDEEIKTIVIMGFLSDAENQLDTVLSECVLAGKHVFVVVTGSERLNWLQSEKIYSELLRIAAVEHRIQHEKFFREGNPDDDLQKMTPEEREMHLKEVRISRQKHESTQVLWSALGVHNDYDRFFKAIRDLNRRGDGREALSPQRLKGIDAFLANYEKERSDLKEQIQDRVAQFEVSESEASQLYYDASRYELCCKYDAAIRCYSDFLLAVPANQDARFRLGQCYRKVGKQELALDQFYEVATAKDSPESLAREAANIVEEFAFSLDSIAAIIEEIEIAESLIQDAYAQPIPDDIYDEADSRLNGVINQLRGQDQSNGVNQWALAQAFESRVRVRANTARHEVERFVAAKRDTIEAYKRYLAWFAKLQIPDTYRSRDARKRLAVLEATQRSGD